MRSRSLAPDFEDPATRDDDDGSPRLSPGLAWAIRAIDHRADLAGLELGEAGGRAILYGALAIVAAGTLLLAGFTITFVVAALVWDTPYRVGVLGAFAALQLVVAIGIGCWLRGRLRVWRPLQSTVEQLRKDYQCLHRLLFPTPH